MKLYRVYFCGETCYYVVSATSEVAAIKRAKQARTAFTTQKRPPAVRFVQQV